MRRELIPHDGRPCPLQPIVYEALRALGVDPGDLARNRLWHDDANRSPEPGRPAVSCTQDRSRVHWEEAGTYVVLYVDNSYDNPEIWEHKVEIRSFGLPETVINACVGMTLDRIVDMPGSQGIRILSAETTAAGHVLDIETVIAGALIRDDGEDAR